VSGRVIPFPVKRTAPVQRVAEALLGPAGGLLKTSERRPGTDLFRGMSPNSEPVAPSVQSVVPVSQELRAVGVGDSMGGGELVRVWREAAGLSQNALARRLGVSQPRVARLEAQDNVTLRVLRAVRAACTT
jgi:DNA-binding XRE family transcriptional regulator